MSEKFSGNNGTFIKLLMKKLEIELEKLYLQDPKRKFLRNSYESGTLTSTDFRNISMGIGALRQITREIFKGMDNQLLLGDKDVSILKKEISGYKNVIDDLFRRFLHLTEDESNLRSKIESLKDYSGIMQAARDGVLLKQETRKERIPDGKLKEVTYDTSMTPREVFNILREYERQSERLQYKKMDIYLGLGLSLAGIIGSLLGKDAENKDKSGEKLISIGTTAIAALRLFQGVILNKDNKVIVHKRNGIFDKRNSMSDDLLFNEQVSNKALEDAIKNISNLAKDERRLNNRIENERFLFDTIIDIAIAIISGLYINSKIQINENGKIDGRSLATAILSLQSNKSMAGSFVEAILGIQEIRKEYDNFNHICEQLNLIIEQMEEKVYPLEGAKTPFNSIKISNFEGRFYPKKNYETGEIEYPVVLKVPEFSMKRGDVVLLSGESGAGKSTFLRLLKRGDINNRQCIQLDNGEIVDNLGNEYISFRPSINLGDGGNVLLQLTGKQNISELKKGEKKRLIKILQELKLDFDNPLEELASKNYTEFSTGQQRRLALTELFYRINDATSVIIVDEPVGNVQDDLIKEQLEMIRNYAKKNNVMLILTTHRLELAEQLATKRYHINSKGVLEQIPVKNKDVIMEK